MSTVPLWIWQLAALVAVGALIYVSLQRIPQGFERVVERGGRYKRTLGAGTHFLLPLLDRAGPALDIRETALRVRTLKVVTRDEIEVDIAVSCFVQITDAARASYEVRDVHAATEELVAAQVANHLAACPLGQLVADRERALRELPERLDRATDVWGIKVTRLDIRDVQPPAPLLQAILAETQAEHEQRARLLHAEGERALELEQNRREHDVTMAQLRAERERTQDADDAAAAANRTKLLTGMEAASLEREAQEQQLRLQAAAAADTARLQRQSTEIAQAAQAAANAAAWRQALDLAQQQREEDAQTQRRLQQQHAHEAELARIAGERAAVESRLAQSLVAERSAATLRAALAQAEHDAAQRTQQFAAEQQRLQLAAAAEQEAIAREQTLMLARTAAERARTEADMGVRVRAAELAYAEATQLARAKDLLAAADARALQLISSTLQGVNAPTLSYLAAREQADALRSLGSSALAAPVAGVAASMIARTNTASLADGFATDTAPSMAGAVVSSSKRTPDEPPPSSS